MSARTPTVVVVVLVGSLDDVWDTPTLPFCPPEHAARNAGDGQQHERRVTHAERMACWR